MSLLNLATAVENLQLELRSLRTEVRAGGDDGRTLLEICSLYRQLGCGLLLGNLDAAEFEEALFKSARCYLWLLECPPGAVDAYYLCRSRGLPLLDALGAGRIDLARRIAGLMQASFNPRMEPEEDYRWLDFLGSGLVLGRQTPDLLMALEKVLEGKPSAHKEVARALTLRDESAFSSALEELASEWPSESARRSRGPEGGPYFPVTEAHVCIEGVALARLALSLGVGCPRHVRFIPDEVLGPPQANFHEDFWP